MPKGGLTFNGVHSSSKNLHIINKPKIPLLPELKDTYIDIPHKDGSILIPDKSAYDIIIEVEFILKPTQNQNIHESALAIIPFLITDKREKLIFDFMPNYYFNAKVIGGVDFERIVNVGTFTVSFRCEPYAKLVGG